MHESEHMTIEKVKFEKDGITFLAYPYPPASIFPSGTIEYSSIREVLIDRAPPEIRTNRGEVLFVSATLAPNLLKAAKKHRIPMKKRVDVWHYILQPFLDTRKNDTEALSVLEANGISKAECQSVRELVKDAMHAYNFTSGLWDWAHLGLMDVLDALIDNGPISACHQYALSPPEYIEFYYRAMQIAERDRTNE